MASTCGSVTASPANEYPMADLRETTSPARLSTRPQCDYSANRRSRCVPDRVESAATKLRTRACAEAEGAIQGEDH